MRGRNIVAVNGAIRSFYPSNLPTEGSNKGACNEIVISTYSPPCDKRFCFLPRAESCFTSNWTIWASPLRISLWFIYADVWRRHTNTYRHPRSLPSAQKNSRSVFTARLSCGPSRLPSHTTTSSTSSAQCRWSNTRPFTQASSLLFVWLRRISF